MPPFALRSKLLPSSTSSAAAVFLSSHPLAPCYFFSFCAVSPSCSSASSWSTFNHPIPLVSFSCARTTRSSSSLRTFVILRAVPSHALPPSLSSPFQRTFAYRLNVIMCPTRGPIEQCFAKEWEKCLYSPVPPPYLPTRHVRRRRDRSGRTGTWFQFYLSLDSRWIYRIAGQTDSWMLERERLNWFVYLWNRSKHFTSSDCYKYYINTPLIK